MENRTELNDIELEQIAGGADKKNPWVLEIWFRNDKTQQRRHFIGSFPTMDDAKKAKNEVNAKYAEWGFVPSLTKIYKAM